MNRSAIDHVDLEADVFRRTTEATSQCIDFLRDLVALPSPSRGERLACERVVREMQQLGFDEVRIDAMGNVLGRVGQGPRILAFDAHIDTVGISNPTHWRVDPFRAKTVGGTMYGRGASDQKGGLAAIVHGAAVAAAIGLPPDVSVWVTATVNGEDCVGLAWRHIIEDEGIRPEMIAIAMPSHLGICRGQRGRLELEIITEGVSTHGSQPDRGANAVMAMAPIILGVGRLHSELEVEHAMLGRGSIAVTGISAESPSFTAIPDGCSIHVDRRLTIGETADAALEQLRNWPEVLAAGARVNLLKYELPSWKGMVRPTDKVFPAWVTAEDSDVFRASLATARKVLGREPRLHRSSFSSHGCVTAGEYNIPTIGFGPADEGHSHTVNDQISLAQLQPAMAFYAMLPAVYCGASDAEQA